MFVGSATLCLRVKDLEQSIRFYEALGLQLVGTKVPGTRAVVRRGPLTLALMTFLPEDCLNFRGEDVQSVYGYLQGKGLQLKGKPEAYAGGVCWATDDPDGHRIFFDTNEAETTPDAKQTRVSSLLRSTEQSLVDLDASEECLRAFREHVLARFGSA